MYANLTTGECSWHPPPGVKMYVYMVELVEVFLGPEEMEEEEEGGRTPKFCILPLECLLLMTQCEIVFCCV